MINDERNLWFRRRKYGYGWTPVSWQGWVTVIIFLAIVLGGIIMLKDAPRNTYSNEVGIYLLTVLIAIALLVVISLKKGPKPKWQWGKSDKDQTLND